MRLRPSFFCFAAVLAVRFFAVTPARAEPANSPSFALLTPPVAQKLKEQAATAEGKTIIRWADEGLSRKPGPLAKLHVEGTLPHEDIHDESVQALKDLSLMLDFALAYQLTEDARYLDAEERFLSAWLNTYKQSLNPVDETDFDQFILAYDLTAPKLPEKTRKQMEAFLRKLATGYLNQISQQKPQEKILFINNWQSFRVKLIALAAFALGDEPLEVRARNAFRQQILANIARDGTVYDFKPRDALHYVVYDLEPLVVVALAAKAHGQDWLDKNSSLPRALDWLTPYALGQKTHEEFVHSTVQLDADRAKAGLKGFSGLWDPATSVYLFQLAVVLDAKYQPTFAQIIKQTKARPQAWLVVLARAAN